MHILKFKEKISHSMAQYIPCSIILEGTAWQEWLMTGLFPLYIEILCNVTEWCMTGMKCTRILYWKLSLTHCHNYFPILRNAFWHRWLMTIISWCVAILHTLTMQSRVQMKCYYENVYVLISTAVNVSQFERNSLMAVIKMVLFILMVLHFTYAMKVAKTSNIQIQTLSRLQTNYVCKCSNRCLPSNINLCVRDEEVSRLNIDWAIRSS